MCIVALTTSASGLFEYKKVRITISDMGIEWEKIGSPICQGVILGKDPTD